MLNSNTLSQLKSLKQQIIDSRDIRTGIFRSTRNRYGFVKDTNGNDVFLPPQEADKLLAGDEVEIEVETSGKDRVQGKIIKLIHSDFKQCYGVCIQRGKGFFVQADDANKQWLFVPPKNRKGAKAGDRVKASLLKHPFNNNGKGQLHIDQVIGGSNKPGIETAYAMASHGLNTTWTDAQLKEAEALNLDVESITESRTLSAYPFVSIDSAATRDVDDAIYCESNNNGWLLVTAIADPTCIIPKGSTLEQAAKARGASIYFPHGPAPMLPESLSIEQLSLLPNKPHPALICEMQISHQGELLNSTFTLGAIQSAAKLSYFHVSEYLNHGTIADEFTEVIQRSLAGAKMATDALNTAKDTDGLLNDDSRGEFRFRLNDAGKIEDIFTVDRSSAHALVEEAMLCTNRSAAQFLITHQRPGPFSVHDGIRPERMTESHTLLKELAPELASDIDPATNQGFATIKAICATDNAKGLIRPLRRLLNRAAIKNEAKPHFGLGYSAYTTMTSPLRRYQDLLVHYQIHAILDQQEAVAMDNAELRALSEQLITNRQAVRQSEADLTVQYAEKLIDKTFVAEVVQLNGRQLILRCLSNGIEGVLPSSALGKKWKYDALRGKISSDTRTVLLGDKLNITIADVDVDTRKINLKLIPDEVQEPTL